MHPTHRYACVQVDSVENRVDVWVQLRQGSVSVCVCVCVSGSSSGFEGGARVWVRLLLKGFVMQLLVCAIGDLASDWKGLTRDTKFVVLLLDAGAAQLCMALQQISDAASVGKHEASAW